LRAALAIGAALVDALAAAAPHVHHAGAWGSHACQACVVRAGEAAASATPDAAPAAATAELLPAAPGLPPVSGLPLGAVPGQSPPLA
jgi:hypothetical protein